jgi:hypothetical protein
VSATRRLQVHRLSYSDELDALYRGLPEQLLLDLDSQPPTLPHIILLHLCWSWIVILLLQPVSHVSAGGGTVEEDEFAIYAMTVGSSYRISC